MATISEREHLHDPVVGTFRLSHGCVAFPEDDEQLLCLHHAMRSNPLGTIDLIAVVDDLPQFERDILYERYPEIVRL